MKSYYLAGTVLNNCDYNMNKTDRVPFPMKLIVDRTITNRQTIT